MGRLIVLSGPSCIGKGPLHAALKKLYPDVAESMCKVVLFNDRAPRPGEVDGVDYRFRCRKTIEGLRDRPGYKAMEVRGDLQAVDIDELKECLESGDAFFEGNPFVGTELLDISGVDALGIFLSPLSREEIHEAQDAEGSIDLEALVTDIMRRKLLRRTQRQKRILSLKDLENVEKRAGSAFREMKLACRFDHVIPNHDGEDSENWDAFYHPVADARRTLHAFVSLVRGETPEIAETWAQKLLGGEGEGVQGVQGDQGV
jgi:guanylate kinase